MSDEAKLRHPETPFPIGVEYYRGPVPRQDVWDADFARIKAAGCSCLSVRNGEQLWPLSGILQPVQLCRDGLSEAGLPRSKDRGPIEGGCAAPGYTAPRGRVMRDCG